jgi:hypothetical protein
MSRLMLMSFAMILFVGCGGPTFTNLGNGVGVPSGAIADHAATNGLTHDEARSRMRAESDQQRIAEHAKKYGISNEEAKEQLEHAGE